MRIRNRKVEAGILSKAIEGFGKLFGKAFADTLQDMDIDREVKDVKSNDEGDIIFTVFPETTTEDGGKLQPYMVKIDQLKDHGDGSGEAWLSIQQPDGKVYRNVCPVDVVFPGVEEQFDENKAENESELLKDNPEDSVEGLPEPDDTDIKDQKTKLLQGGLEIEVKNGDEVKEKLEQFEEDYLIQFPVKSSMQITLSKIVGSENTDIRLHHISCKRNLKTSWKDLNTVLGSEELLDMIPEDDTVSLEIVSDPFDENISIEQIDSLPDPSPEKTGLQSIIAELNMLNNNLIVASSITSDITDSIYNTMQWDAQFGLQHLIKLYYVAYGEVISPNTLTTTNMPVSDYSEICTTIIDNIQTYLSAIQLNYCAFEDVTLQSALSEQLECWNSHLKIDLNCDGVE